jgi:hypothetical protein
MGKHNKKKSKSVSSAQSHSRGPRFLIPGVLVLAVLVGAATWYFLQKPAPAAFAAQYKGGPRLAVDNDLIDLGTVRFQRMVEARFRLRNVGDQPLRLTVNPQIEAIEGC